METIKNEGVSLKEHKRTLEALRKFSADVKSGKVKARIDSLFKDINDDIKGGKINKSLRRIFK